MYMAQAMHIVLNHALCEAPARLWSNAAAAVSWRRWAVATRTAMGLELAELGCAWWLPILCSAKGSALHLSSDVQL